MLLEKISRTLYSLRHRNYRLAIGSLIFVFIFQVAGNAQKNQPEPDSLNIQNDVLDSNFNPSIGFAGRILGAARQSDGRLVIAGVFNSVNGHQQINVARILENGAFDPTFVPPPLYDSIGRLTLQPDGKVLLSFFTTTNGISRAKIIRLNQDGSLDSTFNSGVGTSGTAIGIMLVLADGDILVGGAFSSYNGVIRKGLIRLNSDGSVDGSFTTEINNGDSIGTLVEAADGKIYVGGRFTQIGGVNRNAVAVLEPNGTVVQSFNANLEGQVNEIILPGDGKVLIGGRVSIASNLNHVARLNADGSLDATFTADARINTWVNGIGLHPDGRIFVYGSFLNSMTGGEKTIFLLNPNGSADDSFAPATVRQQTSFAEAFVQNDGKILLVGEFPKINGTAHTSLARLNPDFTNDETYTSYLVRKTLLGLDSIATLAFQDDGKILVGGTFLQANRTVVESIARLNADGSTDDTFNQTDSLFSNDALPSTVYGIALQADGKILVAGNFETVGGAQRRHIARLNTDGTPDASFNTGAGPSGIVYSVAVQTDGKILIAGQFDFVNGTSRPRMARLNSDGTLDQTFNIGSMFNSGNPTEIIVQPDNKILVSGVRDSADTQWRTLVRLNQDGTRDTSFNVILSFGTPDIELQPDGKILVGGVTSVNGQPKAGIARINADGTLDASFTGEISGGGVRTFTRQADGRFLAGGSFLQVQSRTRLGLARLDTGGLLDVDFFEGGSQNNTVTRIYSRPNGKIIVCGNFTTFNNLPKLGLVQFHTGKQTLFDFDGDGKTDISIFRPSLGEWWYQKSSNGGNYAAQFGASSDKLTPADFTGDRKTDIALFRPSTGEWFVLRSEDASFYSFPFGTSGDVPFTGDFDADGRADNGVYRPSTSTWYIRKSSDGSAIIQTFGQTGDVPVVADYDGDGKSDIAIYRVALGEWWIQRSSSGIIAFQFGNSNDKPTQGDYTGDGKADVALFRPSTGEWFILRSENQSYYSFGFGANGDVPSPGDYDGDGKTDATVFRPSTSTWYVNKSTGGNLIQTFGQTGDVPVPNAFVP